MAQDRRLRLLVGVLSASTLIEGMVDVLVVVTALELVDLGGAGVGWLNAAWGVGGLAGGAVALDADRPRPLRLALPAGGLLIGLPLIALGALPLPVAALVLLLVLGVGYSLVEVAGHHAAAATGARPRPRPRVRRRRELVLADDGRGRDAGAAGRAVAGPRGALVIVGAALPLVVLSRWAALTRLAGTPRRITKAVRAQHVRV